MKKSYLKLLAAAVLIALGITACLLIIDRRPPAPPKWVWIHVYWAGARQTPPPECLLLFGNSLPGPFPATPERRGAMLSAKEMWEVLSILRPVLKPGHYRAAGGTYVMSVVSIDGRRHAELSRSKETLELLRRLRNAVLPKNRRALEAVIAHMESL